MDSAIKKTLRTAVLSAGVVALGWTASTWGGDEPGRLGRLFGLGPKPTSAPSGEGAASPAAPSVSPSFTSSYGTPGTSAAGASAPGNRIVAQPKHNHAATEADPLVTRISICRAEDGKQFCSFLQIYADGTVLDSDGVHKVGAELLRPIAQVLQSGELTRVKGYCGGPAADYIEQVQTVVYDRAMGRLRAHSLAYSGNPQNCDASVRQLNAAVEAIQTKLMGPPVPAQGTAVGGQGTVNSKPITLTPIP